jgi:hypothetical protein
MNNFEKLMNALTLKSFMDMSIRLVVVNHSKLCWLTSNNQLFDYNDYNTAYNHELNWLMTDDDVKDVNSDNCDCCVPSPDEYTEPVKSEENVEEPEQCKTCGGGENCVGCECELCHLKE